MSFHFCNNSKQFQSSSVSMSFYFCISCISIFVNHVSINSCFTCVSKIRTGKQLSWLSSWGVRRDHMFTLSILNSIFATKIFHFLSLEEWLNQLSVFCIIICASMTDRSNVLENEELFLYIGFTNQQESDFPQEILQAYLWKWFLLFRYVHHSARHSIEREGACC